MEYNQKLASRTLLPGADSAAGFKQPMLTFELDVLAIREM